MHRSSPKNIPYLLDKEILFQAVKACRNFRHFMHKISALNTERLYQIAGSPDKNGTLALEIINDRKDLKIKDQEKIFQYLLQYTLPVDFKKLNERIDFNMILKRYGKELSDSRRENLRIGCEILNIVREEVISSKTALENNGKSYKEVLSIKKWVRRMHNVSDKEIAKKFKEYDAKYSHLPKEESGRDKNQMLLHIVASYTTLFGSGNCEDLSYLACYYAQSYQLPSSIINLTSGDHVVALINNDVIVDPWAGKVCFVEERDVSGYKCIENARTHIKYNLDLPMNPSRQQLMIKKSFESIPPARALFYCPQYTPEGEDEYEDNANEFKSCDAEQQALKLG